MEVVCFQERGREDGRWEGEERVQWLSEKMYSMSDGTVA